MYASLANFLIAPLASFSSKVALGGLLVALIAGSSMPEATKPATPLAGASDVFYATEASAERATTAPAERPETSFRTTELLAELASLVEPAERP